MTQHYLGVKVVTAWPAPKPKENPSIQDICEGCAVEDEMGYGVKYEDGYISWSPKDAFEKAYFPMGESNDGSTITEAMVDAMMGEPKVQSVDEKTTLVTVTTQTGFKQYETSSCVDPKNYDEELGKKYGSERIKGRMWAFMGFVLQWGRFGLNAK